MHISVPTILILSGTGGRGQRAKIGESGIPGEHLSDIASIYCLLSSSSRTAHECDHVNSDGQRQILTST